MEIGSKVKLKVESENDIYSIQLPPQVSVGEIIEISIQPLLKKIFDIEVNFHKVQFKNFEPIYIYEHDLMVFEK